MGNDFCGSYPCKGPLVFRDSTIAVLGVRAAVQAMPLNSVGIFGKRVNYWHVWGSGRMLSITVAR